MQMQLVTPIHMYSISPISPRLVWLLIWGSNGLVVDVFECLRLIRQPHGRVLEGRILLALILAWTESQAGEQGARQWLAEKLGPNHRCELTLTHPPQREKLNRRVRISFELLS